MIFCDFFFEWNRLFSITIFGKKGVEVNWPISGPIWAQRFAWQLHLRSWALKMNAKSGCYNGSRKIRER